jgi:hypothetical protein
VVARRDALPSPASSGPAAATALPDVIVLAAPFIAMMGSAGSSSHRSGRARARARARPRARPRARARCYISRMRLLLLSLTLTTLPACPPGTSSGSKSTEPVTTCTAVGQSCLFAPGKLGLCVERTAPCEGADCIICQSQH